MSRVSMAFSIANSTLFSKSSIFLSRRTRTPAFCLNFSSISTSSAAALPSDKPHSPKKWRRLVAASLVELGGPKLAREEIVKDDPTSNVPDSIFSKLGMQLHRRINILSAF